jgi:two-component system chemotaxis response regulator CheY
MLKQDSKILIVDDMQAMRTIMANMLHKLGHKNLDQAEDGLPAWDMITQAKQEGTQYDLIISDWNMPGMCGIELLKKVRKEADIARTPFLIVTSELNQSNTVTALQEGVDKIIGKPFTLEQLNDTLKQL